MFSVEYFGGMVLITAFNIRRINFFIGEKLRKLILQSMKQDCSKIVLDLNEVECIDAGVVENLKLLQETIKSIGIRLFLVNVSSTLKKEIVISDYKKELTVCKFEDVENLVSINGQ